MRFIVLAIVLASSLFAQQAPAPTAPPAQSDAAAPAVAKQPVIPQTARLNAAKTVYIKRSEAHNDVPFNVIANGFDGWAKYLVVSSPEKADLVIEVSSTEHEEGFMMPAQKTPGISSDKTDEPPKNINKSYSVSNIRMVVIDAHTKTPVWAGNEQPRGATRKNKSDDNLVEAAQRLFQHFHDRVEPPPAQ